MTLRLDLSDCQVDAVIAGSYSAAGLLVADFATDAGSVLLHGNRIRSRFPMGETAMVGEVGEVSVTGNVIANEIAPQLTFQAASPSAQLPSYSLVLNPATTPLGAVLDPSGMLFGDVGTVPAVAVTGNVFIDPTSLPPRPATIPAPLADWDVLNTVISYGLAPPPAVSGISPASGPVGTQVTVTGSGFTAAAEVRFGSTVATFTPGSTDPDGELTATVPAGSGTADVMITTPAGTSPPSGFSYLVVTNVAPASPSWPAGALLPSSAQVAVYGNGFVPGATTVIFTPVGGGAAVESPADSVDTTGLSLDVSGPGTAGSYQESVRTPSGTSAPCPVILQLGPPVQEVPRS